MNTIYIYIHIYLYAQSRLSKLSSNENISLQVAPVYSEALKQTRYNHKLSYNNSNKCKV